MIEIRTSMPFVKKSAIFQEEKAYGSDVYTDTIPRSNIKTHLIPDVKIHDARPKKSDFAFNKDGFEFIDFEASLAEPDWTDQEKVEGVYCLELGRFMRNYLGAKSVQVFEAQVRRRHSSFPYDKIQRGLGFQPAMRPHIDSSRDHIIDKIKILNPENAEELLKKRWSFFTVWKPIKGPVRDWPLTICEPASVRPKRDYLEVDNIIHGQHAVNIAMHYDKSQNWMYLADQMPHEMIVMRQADSRGNGGVPHASFNLVAPEGTAVEPRQSIEVRMIAYFDD